MNVQLVPAQLKDKPLISNLLELYQHDLSEYSPSSPQLSPEGRYGYKYLDSYWEDSARQAFLILASDQVAGFALVNDHLPITTEKPTKAIAEFFILRKYRRSGIGQHAATMIFDQFPGDWQVAQESENLPAQKFWEKIIAEYTHGTYQKQIIDSERWHGPVLIFETSKEPHTHA